MKQGDVSLSDWYVHIANHVAGAWTANWWPIGGPRALIVGVGGKRWEGSPVGTIPSNIDEFGWTGTDGANRLAWVGWDLDLHGNIKYDSLDDALRDAARIRVFLHGHAEVRLSKSGLGVHVRHRLQDARVRPATDGPKIAKAVAARLSLKADPAALGRQMFWFWTKDNAPRAFELVEKHEGIFYE